MSFQTCLTYFFCGRLKSKQHWTPMGGGGHLLNFLSLIAFVYRRPDHDKTFLECVQFPQSSSTAVCKHETPTAGK